MRNYTNLRSIQNVDFFVAKSIRLMFAVPAIMIGIICPLVVYKATSSLTMAGVMVLADWLPKMLVYFYSGEIVKKYGMSSIHPKIEYLRLFAVVLVLISFMGYLPWWIIIITSSFFHCVLAVMNVAYEVNVKRWLPNSSVGHASLLQIDAASGLIAMGLCFFIRDLIVLVWIIIFCSVILIITLKKYGKDIYNVPHDNTIKVGFLSPFKAIPKFTKELWALTLVGLACGIPMSIFLGALPFFIEYGLGHKINIADISTFSFLRMAGGFILLHFCIILLKKYSDFSLFLVGTMINFASLLVLVFLSNYWYLAMMLIFCSTVNMLYPWQRSIRQVFMKRDGTEYLTGLFIAFQGAASFFGAVLIWTFSGELYLILSAIAIYVISLFLGLLLLFGKQKFFGAFKTIKEFTMEKLATL
jgi:hypothetical protein